MRELSKSHYSRRICPPQCVRVIQTRKVRTGQNTSIYHRMNGINGYEFELLFKWVTKLYLWEPRVLRIGFTSVKPKPWTLREALKKLIIPIGANIVFTQKLDKAWIIIDTVVVKPFTSPPALIVRWIRGNLKYGHHLMSRFWSANKWWVLSKRSIQASGVEFPRVLRTIRFSVQFKLIANFTGHFYTSAYQGHIQLRFAWQSRICVLWILMPILSNLLWHYCAIVYWQSSKYGSLACMRKGWNSIITFERWKGPLNMSCFLMVVVDW